MSTDKDMENRLAVLTNWGLWGSFGIGFVLSGFRSHAYPVGLFGFGLLAAGFVCHLIINRIYGVDFREGEIATAFGLSGIAILGFVASWIFDPAFTRADVMLGLTGCIAAVAGVFAYVATRFGLRGSFSMFHHVKRQT
jgi:hypothetical protein